MTGVSEYFPEWVHLPILQNVPRAMTLYDDFLPHLGVIWAWHLNDRSHCLSYHNINLVKLWRPKTLHEWNLIFLDEHAMIIVTDVILRGNDCKGVSYSAGHE